jgi:alkaline phosphatase D
MLLTRRRLLTSTAGGLAALAAPRISRASDRPQITHGIQSGDVSASSGVVWARSDRPARMEIEYATTDSFRDMRRAAPVDALPDSDFTAKVLLDGLPPGQTIFYRVRFQDLASPTISGDMEVGQFKTAPQDRRSLSFAWSADVAGQGYGIDLARGGMRTFETIRRNAPDFFVHCGDHIYADNPILAEMKMPNGEIWRNLVVEEKAKPAETLAEFRGNWKYNLLDRNLLAFNAAIPTLSQWDDHEVMDNWWPGEELTRAFHRRLNYVEPNNLAMSARANRAFFEYTPTLALPAEPGRIYRKVGYGPLLDVFLLDMRSYRGPNGTNTDDQYGPASHFLGPAQLAWLKRELAASRATWKVISADQPLSVPVRYDSARNFGWEAVAQADDGAPRGRELEIADLLSFIQRAGVRNTVWITADVHYAAAHYYDPGKAAFTAFDPFWEFIAGPLHAFTGFPRPLDRTFGPQAIFTKGATAPNSPADGMQFFGLVQIDGDSQVMTVSLKDVSDTVLWSGRIEPRLG